MLRQFLWVTHDIQLYLAQLLLNAVKLSQMEQQRKSQFLLNFADSDLFGKKERILIICTKWLRKGLNSQLMVQPRNKCNQQFKIGWK